MYFSTGDFLRLHLLLLGSKLAMLYALFALPGPWPWTHNLAAAFHLVTWLGGLPLNFLPQKFRILQSVYGPSNVTPFSRFSQLKRHKSTFFSAPYPDIYSQDDMSSYNFLVCYERKNHAPSSNLKSSSLDLNLRRYESGSLSSGFNNPQRIKEDHVQSLVQDYGQSMHILGEALPCGHSHPREIWVGNKHIWSQEARVLKEKKAKFKKNEVEVETSSGELKNSPHYDMACGCSDVDIVDGETFSSTIINAADSSCMNLPATIEEQIGVLPKEARAAKNVNKNNGKDSTEAVPCINGSSFARQVRSEKQEQCKLSKETSTSEQNGVADNETYIEPIIAVQDQNATGCESRARLLRIYNKVLVVNDIDMAIKLVGMLTKQYRHLIYACDTEVSNIDVKQETPVDHGEIICFSIYSGKDVDFGGGKTCIWVDVLDGGGKELLAVFAPFFEDSSIKKVWHNYSFDSHVIQNYGIKLSGFHADTMHMARLWNSSRRTDGGYSLEALTSDEKVMSGSKAYKRGDLFGKISMKDVFGRRKVKKDGSVGKTITIPPVEQLQREDREAWISYSSLDALSTFNLYDSLQVMLSKRPWRVDDIIKGHMLNFYEKYWKPFGEILVQMETEGMLVDRVHLAKVEKVAVAEQQAAADRFRNWASRYCPGARYMNIGSDAQLRLLFFGGIMNRKNNEEFLPEDKVIRVPNTDNFIEDGKKFPIKYRNIQLYRLSKHVINTELFTATGWPSVSGESLKALAGKVSAVYDFSGDTSEVKSTNDSVTIEAFNDQDVDISAYGTAYAAFGEGKEGKEACHAIAALCEVCSIDSLISNFILPLQGSHVSGKNGRIHCSLNINTETGRLSARRPNLQNQPALEKDRYKIRQAFIAAPGKTLIVADYGQLELRILAHLADCRSMKEAFKAGGDFHSRTAMNMYPYIREAIETGQVLLEWHPQPGEDKPPVPLLKDTFGSERRKAKMLNFSIAYGKTPVGLSRDWKVSVKEAEETVDLWYSERKEVLKWQVQRKREAVEKGCVHTLLGRARHFPLMKNVSRSQRGHIERAAINTPVQGSAADVTMCAMLEIVKNARLKELGWKLLLQVHDEVILEGPTESAEEAKNLVVKCMSKPFDGKNILDVDLAVDAKCAQNWYAAK